MGAGKPSSKKRPLPDTEWEVSVGHPGRVVAGVDEVGRGCLAGPVVAAAVVLPPHFRFDFQHHPWLSQVTDSKLVSPSKREELAPLIRNWARASAIGVVSVEEIDQLNIYHASHLAMLRAIAGLGLNVEHVLVDGNVAPKNLRCGATAIVKGDQRCLSIACASILAKVWRDQEMVVLDRKYPGYGFAIHKGYSTPTHADALKRLGAVEVHRRSFAPVAAVLSGKDEVSKAGADEQSAFLF